MPTYPSVTYTFVNGNASDASQVNQNFTDIINGLSDGTKDIQVNDITANGSVTLGASTADTVTFNALLGNATFNQAAGDPQINFKIGGTQKFSMGVDDSDSDMFKLSTTADIGTTPAFQVNSNGEFAYRGMKDGATATSHLVGYYVDDVYTTTRGYSTGTIDDPEGTAPQTVVVTLTSGVWDIQAMTFFDPTGANFTEAECWIGTASGSSTAGLDLKRNNTRMLYPGNVTSFSANNGFRVMTPMYRQNITAETSYYCKCRAYFTSGTVAAGGSIWARRVA